MKKILILAPLACCFLAAAAAATTVVGTGSPASCTEASLNAAITEANGTFGIVTFNCGPAPHTLIVSSEKPLATGVVIDGGGRITLSGGNNTRIFNLFQGAAVAIQDLTLTRGFATHGGCIVALGSNEKPTQLFLTRVTFDKCGAQNYGGAIAATAANLQIADSTFLQNLASTGGGGAISLNAGGLGITGSDFIFNDAFDQGGALQVWFSTVQIAGSEFVGNDTSSGALAGGGGGALLLRGSSLVSADNDYRANGSSNPGGAVQLQDSSTGDFQNDRFRSNDASLGGGIYADSASTLTLQRSTLQSNFANGDGGALYGSGLLLVDNSTFFRNFLNAPGQGAAIYIAGGGVLSLVNATLVDNFRFDLPIVASQIGWVAGAAVGVHNTLVQSPGVVATACSGPAASAAFSFSLWDDDSCPLASGAGNGQFAFVSLKPLGLSCGSAATELTVTYALPQFSAAVDRGSCRPGDPAFDQRGMPRPQGAACDVGATEFYVPCDGPFFADGFETGNTTRWSVTLP